MMVAVSASLSAATEVRLSNFSGTSSTSRRKVFGEGASTTRGSPPTLATATDRLSSNSASRASPVMPTTSPSLTRDLGDQSLRQFVLRRRPGLFVREGEPDGRGESHRRAPLVEGYRRTP